MMPQSCGAATGEGVSGTQVKSKAWPNLEEDMQRFVKVRQQTRIHSCQTVRPLRRTFICRPITQINLFSRFEGMQVRPRTRHPTCRACMMSCCG